MQSNISPVCTECGNHTHVTHTLYEVNTYKVIRQRKCRVCGHRMVTRQDREEVLTSQRIEWPKDFDSPAGKLVRVVPA